ncbi:hypothetical protein E3P99_02243 [Wallemia hederae]|uniref:Ubinuclein middle domain-containing protein n=1 Tax=Wallemia hederae TaxID=1540922 RepID=A0A4T0FLW1_9BASI|nr:hypothetical protein E3P99_02243 [Wallemia hederae]
MEQEIVDENSLKNDNKRDLEESNDSNKVVKKRKQRTPSPPVLETQLPLKTVRLDVDLSNDSNYAFNFVQLSKASSQITPEKPYSNLINLMEQLSDGEEAAQLEKRYDNYDVNDPFVDDSELMVDEPKVMAKPTKEGFYITIGDVELETQSPTQLKDKKKEADKDKQKKRSSLHNLSKYSSFFPKPQLPATPIAPDISFEGFSVDASDTPVNNKNGSPAIASQLKQTPEPSGTQTRTDVSSIFGPKKGGLLTGFTMEHLPSPSWSKGKKEYPIEPISEDLQNAFEQLTVLIMKEDFEQKTKFPQSLKDPLKRTAEIAIQLEQYDETHFFNRLPRLFPYNRFTMMKLTKNMLFDYHKKFYEERYELCKQAFKSDVDSEKEQYVNSLEEAVKQYQADWNHFEERYPEEAKEAQDYKSASHTLKYCEHQQAPDPPKIRWKYTEKMNTALMAMVEIQEDIYHLDLERSDLDKNHPAPAREQTYRSKVYAELAAVFPPEWMHTTEISRKRTQLLSRVKNAKLAQPAVESKSNDKEKPKDTPEPPNATQEPAETAEK